MYLGRIRRNQSAGLCGDFSSPRADGAPLVTNLGNWKRVDGSIRWLARALTAGKTRRTQREEINTGMA
ncbi:uncharacterized protein ANIA_11469 [Aspergillus nidulans FGSC A4]|uniref:Uncharacterized protein n=1 Tax=Emericella nidulans (strain FGSC A4 / ATCC 38163 / CBS 112.46 / NRRL 194 / M139) TaxID=227321 RepID=C8VF75_EMENI|nr:hypothetical protein [Aspergillus nidulans FGSC A4]CBF81069.1 TPA: hypothetical protein ANIA_11469 [Aspergillus nidulans FGSC A4]